MRGFSLTSTLREDGGLTLTMQAHLDPEDERLREKISTLADELYAQVRMGERPARKDEGPAFYNGAGDAVSDRQPEAARKRAGRRS
jgi:hypothetical protein